MPCLSLLPLLLLLLLLLCLSLPSAKSTELSTPNCSNVFIPYPFGIVGNTTTHAAGFEIMCPDSPDLPGPFLFINDYYLPVLNISLLEGYVSIMGNAFAHQCINNSVFSLEGTNFTFSDTRNKFMAVGCDVVAMLLNDSSGYHDTHKYSGGCVSFCSTKDSLLNGACSGMGCCQAPVPRGLKKLDLEFMSIRKQLVAPNKDNSAGQCGLAFIVEHNSYVFSTADLRSTNKSTTQYRPVVLEWSIDGSSCEEVKDLPTYACKENAYCYNSSNGIGYRCNCSQGFEGNPYLQGPGGCQDIDECLIKNPCMHKCINKVGSFYCMCPPGMRGDGMREGSGCNGVSTLQIAIGAGLALLVLLLLLVFWTRWLVNKRRIAKKRQRYFMQNGGLLLQQHMSSQRVPMQIFTLSQLDKATNSFGEDHIVGRGGYGTVYKGILSDHMVVAIKKAQRVDQSQMEQFINEMVILSQVNHKNVVQLLGCCLETEVPLLIYEFISNGTLFHHLHNSSVAMSWEDRLRVAVETAFALAYLHLTTKIPIIHRDVKSSNILLDESFTSKVSDFGASRLVPYNQTHVTTLVQGTLGYLDPEYFQTSQLTEKSDVYSFGVVLVELLTRQKPISDRKTEEERNLSWHFSMLFHQNRLLEIVDPQVAKEAGLGHVKAVAHVALKCLKSKGEVRPRMIEVAVAVELEALQRLMKHLGPEGKSEESSLLQGLKCHEEIYVGESSSSNLDDIGKDESIGEIYSFSRDISS